MNFPDNLKYTKDHEWIRIGDVLIEIGITDFAQRELGEIVYVEVETEGESLEAGAVFGSVEAVKTVSDLFMPVAGAIVAFNEALEDNPELVNEDPYNAGWMIKVKPTDLNDVKNLLSAEAYRNEVEASE